jgi:hypothetical protein
MDSRSGASRGAVKTLSDLLAVYSHLQSSVDPTLSSTAAYLKGGAPQMARERLVQESKEALAVLTGGHSHAEEKTELAVRLLRDAGCPVDHADLLLELNQISYWAILLTFRSGGAPAAARIERALMDGSTASESIHECALALEETPTAENAYRLIGRISAEASIPPTLFAQLDLQEMARRSYLVEFVRGL